MNEGLIASRYAKALLLSVEGKEELGQQIYDEAVALVPVLESNSYAIRELLDNVVLSAEKKSEALEKVFNRYAPRLMPYASFLLRKGRGHYLALSLRLFLDLYRAKRGIVKAQILVASPVDRAQVERLRELVQSSFDGVVELDQVVEDDLIGGFQLRVGDQLLDRSVRGELERIAAQLVD